MGNTKLVLKPGGLAFWSSWAEAQLLPASDAKHQLQKREEMDVENSFNFMSSFQQQETARKKGGSRAGFVSFGNQSMGG